MTAFALNNVATWVDGHDFTGDSNKIALNVEVEDLESTTFASLGWKERKGGLRSVDASLEGWWASATSDSVDSDTFSTLGLADRVVTVSTSGTALDPAFFFQASKLKYSMFDEVGSLTPFSLDMSGSNTVGAVRGQVAKARGAVSGTGAVGSAVQLGAPSATQFVYAAFHVFGTPGTTISAKVESDNAFAFSSPTSVQTFGPITAAGGTWVTRTAGPLTDDWFRFNVTAITGTFVVAGAIAVG